MKKLIVSVLAASALALLATGCTCAKPQANRWEYKVLVGKLGMDGADLQDNMNKAAAEGWQLVSVLTYVEGRPMAVMRKPAK